MRKTLFFVFLAVVFASAFALRGEVRQGYRLLRDEFRMRIERRVTDTITQAIQGQIIAPPPLRVHPSEEPPAQATKTLDAAGVIRETNAARAQNNLPPLIANAELAKAASLKVKDMFAKQYFEHESPTGEGPGDLADAAGYRYVIVGENLALGNFEGNHALVDAWMASPGHRENILHSRYREIGVAVGKGQFEGRSVWLAVQEFGLPLSACPYPDEALAARIEARRSDLDRLEAELTMRRAEFDRDGRENRKKVEEYNALVAEYNEILAVVKAAIAEYNAQVASFNECAGQ